MGEEEKSAKIETGATWDWFILSVLLVGSETPTRGTRQTK